MTQLSGSDSEHALAAWNWYGTWLLYWEVETGDELCPVCAKKVKDEGWRVAVIEVSGEELCCTDCGRRLSDGQWAEEVEK